MHKIYVLTVLLYGFENCTMLSRDTLHHDSFKEKCLVLGDMGISFADGTFEEIMC